MERAMTWRTQVQKTVRAVLDEWLHDCGSFTHWDYDRFAREIAEAIPSPNTPPNAKCSFEFGDLVEKREGYKFPGSVRAIYPTESGQVRVVVELSGYGLQHIFDPRNLVQRDDRGRLLWNPEGVEP
jgi:hypothetical protein